MTNETTLRGGPAIQDGDKWRGSTIDPKRHWRTNTTEPCAHLHATREAALRCGEATAAKS